MNRLTIKQKIKCKSKKVNTTFLLFLIASINIAQNTNTCGILKKTIEKFKSNVNAFHVKFTSFNTDDEDTLRYIGDLYYNNTAPNQPPFYILEANNSNYIYFNNTSYYGVNNVGSKEFTDLSKTDSTKRLKGKMISNMIPDFLINPTFFNGYLEDCDSKLFELKETNESFIISYEDKIKQPILMKGKVIGMKIYDLTSFEIDKKTYLIKKHYWQVVTVMGGVESKQIETHAFTPISISKEDIITKIENEKPLNKLNESAKAPDINSVKTGSIFPNFILKDLNNNDYADSKLKSRYVLVEFFYKSCAPCIINMKQLNKIDSMFSKKDLTILAINDVDTGLASLKNFINKFNLGYTVLYQAKSLAGKLNFNRHPQTFVYDNKDRKIVYENSGGGPTYYIEMKLVLDKIINHDKIKSYTAVLITCISVILGLVLFVLTRSHTRSATRQR